MLSLPFWLDTIIQAKPSKTFLLLYHPYNPNPNSLAGYLRLTLNWPHHKFSRSSVSDVASDPIRLTCSSCLGLNHPCSGHVSVILANIYGSSSFFLTPAHAVGIIILILQVKKLEQLSHLF